MLPLLHSTRVRYKYVMYGVRCGRIYVVSDRRAKEPPHLSSRVRRKERLALLVFRPAGRSVVAAPVPCRPASVAMACWRLGARVSLKRTLMNRCTGNTIASLLPPVFGNFVVVAVVACAPSPVRRPFAGARRPSALLLVQAPDAHLLSIFVRYPRRPCQMAHTAHPAHNDTLHPCSRQPTACSGASGGTLSAGTHSKRRGSSASARQPRSGFRLWSAAGASPGGLHSSC